MEDKFTEQCKLLRSRFEIHNSENLFPSEESTVPLDGLSIFIDKTWEKIKT